MAMLPPYAGGVARLRTPFSPSFSSLGWLLPRAASSLRLMVRATGNPRYVQICANLAADGSRILRSGFGCDTAVAIGGLVTGCYSLYHPRGYSYGLPFFEDHHIKITEILRACLLLFAGSQPGNQIPSINSANPVMSLVAFLAAEVGPRVAASCASAALSVLTRDDSRMHAEGNDAMGHATHLNYGPSSSISSETVKNAAICGLSAAATKSKLFADQEEREIQRLSATIINHQLKRLELKLKQFAEIETMLLKESERLEMMRQQLVTQRVRLLSTRFTSTGGTVPGGSSSMVSNPMNQATGLRPLMMPGSMSQSSMPAMYANNMQGHPQMALLQQRQQMLSFGPRLPLSAINPGSSSSAPNIMFNPGMPNSAAPNYHTSLRSPSGSNSNVG